MRRLLVFATLLLAMPAGSAAASPARGCVVPVSPANDGSTSDSSANFFGAAADGSVVYFVTSDQLLPEDTDTAADISARRGADLELVSVPAPGAPGSGAGQISPRKVSADGSSVVFQTNEALTPDDVDEDNPDLYERSGGVTRLVSAPEDGFDPGFEFPFYSPFVDVSPKGRFVAFATDSKLTPSDSDGNQDVYVYDRDTGMATLASPGGSGNVAILRAGG